MIATYSGTQKILKEALKKGYATSGRCWSQGQQVVEKLLSNIASLEKSLLAFAAVLHWQKLLFGLSQGKIVGTDQTCWFRVMPDELIRMLGEALKVGVPMEVPNTIIWGTSSGYSKTTRK